MIKLPNISQEKFLFWGSILLSISVAGSLYSLILKWTFYDLGAKISAISGFLMSCLFALLFISMYAVQVKQTKIINSPEIDKLLQDLSKKDKEEKNGKE